jgi:hypothetical protein
VLEVRSRAGGSKSVRILVLASLGGDKLTIIIKDSLLPSAAILC